MMRLENLINKSWYGSIGYIKSVETLESLMQYLVYNQQVLTEYKGIVVAYNCADNVDESVKQDVETLWTSFFKEKPVTVLFNDVNRGHNHGYADLDNMLINYCKEFNIDWLCKSADDMILLPEVLDISIVDGFDFYYMNGIGYGGMVKYDFDYDRIIREDFYPQTNYYFININKIDYLNSEHFLNETYEYIQSIPNYNGKIWEYIQNWSCEDMLKQCVNRNQLTRCHMIDDATYKRLLELVYHNQVHDCSHKQILINGVCHMPYLDETITKI